MIRCISPLGSPTDSLSLAKILQSLALVYSEESRPELAAEVALESFNILRERLPDGNQELVMLLLFLGESYFDSNQAGKAIYYYQLAYEQLELVELTERNQFPEELGILIKQGLSYFDKGNHPKAMKMFEEAKRIYEKKARSTF